MEISLWFGAVATTICPILVILFSTKTYYWDDVIFSYWAHVIVGNIGIWLPFILVPTGYIVLWHGVGGKGFVKTDINKIVHVWFSHIINGIVWNQMF